MDTLKFLILGDIVGKIGRKAVSSLLPGLRKKFEADLVIANAENLAHGSGITLSTIKEMRDAGVDVFTSGNHIWANSNLQEIISVPGITVLRPANYSNANPGYGFKTIELKKQDETYKILIINLQGRVHMKDLTENPFLELQRIASLNDARGANAILVDFHAEVSSEKTAMCLYADDLSPENARPFLRGAKISAVWGTHTHTPMGHDSILAGGTAAVLDIGMSGAYPSVIGFEKTEAVRAYLLGIMPRAEIPETGSAELNAIFIEVDTKTSKAVKLIRIREELQIH